MGQGAESCGGYEVDDDPYADGLESGHWTMRDSQKIHVDQMSLKHLKGARQVALRAASRASFSSDAEKWNDWVETFDRAIEARKENIKQRVTASPKLPARGAMRAMVCHCGAIYQARQADIARSWGLSCSKRCASIRREFGRPAAKPKEQPQ